MSPATNIKRRAIWRYYWTLLRDYRGALASGFALAVMQSLLILPLWWLAHYIFSHVAPQRDPRQILWAGAGLVLLQVAHSLFGTLTRYRLSRLEHAATERLHTEVLCKLQLLPRSYYTAQQEGQLSASLSHDLGRAQRCLQVLLAQILPAAVVAFCLSLLLLWLQVWLFVGLLALGAVWYAVNVRLSKRLRAQSHEQAEARKKVSRTLGAFITKLDLLRVQTAEEYQAAQQQRRLEDLTALNRRVARWHIWHGSVQQMLLASISIALLAGGYAAWAQGWLAPAQVLTLYAALWLLRPQMQQLANGVPTFTESLEGLETLHAFLTYETALPYTGRRRIRFQGRITFENVSFRYEDDAPVLENLSFTLEPGTVNLLLGPNGTGKTTVGHLLMGFYRPQQGRVLADGVPYDELDIVDLRRQMGAVMQEALFLPYLETVREQITLGCPDATLEEVVRAAQLATAHDFISSLPDGYETSRRVGMQLFSGGQKQRIFLARALLRRPRLLLLDEPTNHLDAAAIESLTTHLQQLPDAPTLFIISHNAAFQRLARQSIILAPAQTLAHAAGQR